METLQLSANSREKTTKGHLNSLRQANRIPAVIYGLKQEPQIIDLPTNETQKCLEKDNKNKVIEIDINGQKQNTIVTCTGNSKKLIYRKTVN